MATVAKLVEKELKSILQRDINKKLCESYAFLLFDKWWADKVTRTGPLNCSVILIIMFVTF